MMLEGCPSWYIPLKFFGFAFQQAGQWSHNHTLILDEMPIEVGKSQELLELFDTAELYSCPFQLPADW